MSDIIVSLNVRALDAFSSSAMFLPHGENQTRGPTKVLEVFVLIKHEWLWQILVLVSGSVTGCVMRTSEFGS